MNRAIKRRFVKEMTTQQKSTLRNITLKAAFRYGSDFKQMIQKHQHHQDNTRYPVQLKTVSSTTVNCRNMWQ